MSERGLTDVGWMCCERISVYIRVFRFLNSIAQLTVSSFLFSRVLLGLVIGSLSSWCQECALAVLYGEYFDLIIDLCVYTSLGCFCSYGRFPVARARLSAQFP